MVLGCLCTVPGIKLAWPCARQALTPVLSRQPLLAICNHSTVTGLRLPKVLVCLGCPGMWKGTPGSRSSSGLGAWWSLQLAACAREASGPGRRTRKAPCDFISVPRKAGSASATYREGDPGRCLLGPWAPLSLQLGLLGFVLLSQGGRTSARAPLSPHGDGGLFTFPPHCPRLWLIFLLLLGSAGCF